MSVEGQPGETELLVGVLRDGGREGYFYHADDRLVQARMVDDRFIVENADDGTPVILTAVRFNVEAGGTAPRACAVPRPVQVAPGESLQGIYMNGVATDQYLSVSVRPSKTDLAAHVVCTLTRVK